MGVSKLYQQQDSSVRSNDVFYVVHSSIARSLDEVIKQAVKMGEVKLALFILTLIGVPAYLYAWFLNVNPDYDLIKSIILGSIGAFTGLVIGLRQLTKLSSEVIKLWEQWKEFKNKHFHTKKNKQHE